MQENYFLFSILTPYMPETAKPHSDHPDEIPQ